MKTKNKYGTLYLIPVGLGNDDFRRTIPAHNSLIINNLNDFIVEDIRSSRRNLRKMEFTGDFDACNFYELNQHTHENEIPNFLNGLLLGKNVGLMSEAGNPCIADPGNKVVLLAHLKGIRIVPLVGPSSILLALISSGMNGQSFTFHGYLPIEKKDRQQKIREMLKTIAHTSQTQIFMETPYRNNALLTDILAECNDQVLLCIASELTTESESITTEPIGWWKKNTPDLHKKPSVFLLGKGNL